MSETDSSSEELPNNRLDEIIARYLEDVRAGNAPDQRELLQQHPESADELKSFFADHDKMQGLAGDGQEYKPEAQANGSDACSLDDPTLPPENDKTERFEPPASAAKGAPPLGTKIRYFGDYELLEEIARGGMGVVYKARQMKLNRIVALKMILAGQLASQEDVQRFYSEAESAAQLDHPGIVPIFEVGEHEGQHFFSMGYVDGQSLAHRIADGPLPPREGAELMKTVAEAVQYAHNQGVIHRDLKPANILLKQSRESRVESQEQAGSRSGSQLSSLNSQPVVTDFGLAKRVQGDSGLTATGQIIGTPSYMPPEQAAGRLDQVKETADVYALGAVLYATLTGRPPFQTDNPLDTLLQVLEREPLAVRQLNASVPRDLETICLKCLEKDRRSRYSTAQDVANELTRYLNGEPIHARPISTTSRAWRWCRRNPVVAALIAGVVLLTLTGTCISTFFAIQWRNRADEAIANAQRADREAGNAIAAQKLAESKEDESRRRLGQLFVEKGVQMMDQRDGYSASTWFLEALRVESDNPARAELHRRRLGYTLRHGPKLVQSMRFNGKVILAQSDANGSRVVTQAADGEVQVWDVASGEPISSPLAFDKPMSRPARHVVRLSPDGQSLVALNTVWWEDVKLWNLTSGDSVILPRSEKSYASFAAFSPDSRLVLLVEQERELPIRCQLRVCDTQTGRIVHGPFQHDGWASWTSFSPDGQRLVLAGGEGWQDKPGHVDVLDISTGERVMTSWEHEYHVHSVRFDQGQRRAVTVSGPVTYSPAHGEAHVWDTEAGQALPFTLRHDNEPDHGLHGAEFSPDGRWIRTSGDLTVRLWDAATGREVGRTIETGSRLSYSEYSPDGRHLLTVSDDRVAQVWDVTSGEAVTPKLRWADQARFGSDGHRVLTTSGNTARLWDSAHSPAEQITPDTNEPVYRIAITNDRRRMAIVAGESQSYGPCKVRIRDLTGGWVGPEIDHDTPVWYVAFAADGRRLLTVSQLDENNEVAAVRVWDASTGKQTIPPIRPQPFTASASSALFSPDGSRVLTVFRGPSGRARQASDDHAGVVQVWDATTGESASPPVKTNSWINHAAFSPDGFRVVVATGDAWYDDSGEVMMWNLAESKPRVLPHDQPVLFVAFSPDGKRIATAIGHHYQPNGSAHVFDAASGDRIVAPLPHAGPVYRLEFGRDGRRLLTSGRGMARVWDVDSGRPLIPPIVTGSPEQVVIATLAPDGSCLATFGDGVRLWDAMTGVPMGPQWGNGINATDVEFSPDSDAVFIIATDDFEERAAVWRLEFAPDKRFITEMERFTQLLSGHKVDSSGALSPVSDDRAQGVWDQLQPAHADEFIVTADQLLAWHRDAAKNSADKDAFAAAFHLSRVLERDPEDIDLRHRRAEALNRSRQFVLAVADCTAVLAERPDHDSALFQRAHALVHLGRWAEAATDLGRAGDVRGQALCYLANNDLDGYRRVCQTIVESFEQYGMTANEVAWTCALAPDAVAELRSVVAMVERELSGESDDAFLNTVGAILYRAGRCEDAIGRLNEAIEKHRTQEGTAHDWLFLALAHHQAGRRDEAVKWLDKAIKWVDHVVPERRELKDGVGVVELQAEVPIVDCPDCGRTHDYDWTQRVELVVLCRDAESMIYGTRQPDRTKPNN